MKYVILKDEETDEIIKLGRFGENFLQEKFYKGEWVRDDVLDGQLHDGWLEEISEAEAEKIINFYLKREKIAA